MKVNIERLKTNLLNLARFGSEKGKGITRPAFSTSYKKAHDYVKSLMEKASMEIYEDPVGNLFGKIKGNEVSQKTIMIGSHIDTVPSGGMFDGSLGVISAIECVSTLIENKYKNNHSIEVVVFVGEEGSPFGSTFGSRCFTGDIRLSDNEISKLKDYGLSKESVKASKRDLSDIKSFVELHIEQGNLLDDEKIPIGIVKGIVGIARYKAFISGKTNHAGTTPMNLRDDALIKASQVILKFNEIVKKAGDNLVGTIGKIEVFPGVVNVIPGKAELMIELRDMGEEKIKKVIENLEQEVKNLNVSIEKIVYKDEVYLDYDIQNIIEEACQELGYSYKYLISGAGHDASVLSKVIPTGMIFVPSKNGISHSPEEHTDWEYIEKGANVLLNVIQKLDNR